MRIERLYVQYEAVLFDMDGVLLTGYHTPREVYRRAAEEILIDHGVEDPPKSLWDPDDVGEWRRACAEHDVPVEEVWRRREEVASELENERIAAGHREPFDDVEAITNIAVPTGIVSNNRLATVEFVVEHFDLDATVAHGRDPTLDGFERLKPDSHYLHRACSDLGVEPVDTLYVGDRFTDVEAARSAGADAALLARDGDPSGEPEPHHVIDSLHDLHGIC